MTVEELKKRLEKMKPKDQIYIQDPEEFYLRKIEDVYPVKYVDVNNYFAEEDELPKWVDKFKKTLVITCKDHV